MRICRACKSKNIYKLELNKKFIFFSIYLTRDKEFENFYCFDCGAISHYSITSESETKYHDGSYRARKINYENIQPISLPWSTITNKRCIHIYKYLSRYLTFLKQNSSKEEISISSILDYGGYNGFTSYGLSKLLDLKSENIFVADLDNNGLNIAKSLGMNPIDLRFETIEKLDFKNIDFCMLVHVLEHIDDPLELIFKLNRHLPNRTIVYIEVPNLYGFPLCDPAHLTSFSSKSLRNLLSKAGMTHIKHGFSSTPFESILYGYPFSGLQENIYFLCITNNKSCNSYENIISKEVFLKKRKFKKKILFLIKLFFSNLKVSIFPILNYFILGLYILSKFVLYFIRFLLTPVSFIIFIFSCFFRIKK